MNNQRERGLEVPDACGRKWGRRQRFPGGRRGTRDAGGAGEKARAIRSVIKGTTTERAAGTEGRADQE